MNRNRKNRGVISKDGRGAVPMMHIRINYNGLFHRAICLQLSNPHSYVVNRAESFAMPGIRMMESPAEIRPKPVATRALPRENRSTRGQPHRFDQLLCIS